MTSNYGKIKQIKQITQIKQIKQISQIWIFWQTETIHENSTIYAYLNKFDKFKRNRQEICQTQRYRETFLLRDC